MISLLLDIRVVRNGDWICDPPDYKCFKSQNVLPNNLHSHYLYLWMYKTLFIYSYRYAYIQYFLSYFISFSNNLRYLILIRRIRMSFYDCLECAPVTYFSGYFSHFLDFSSVHSWLAGWWVVVTSIRWKFAVCLHNLLCPLRLLSGVAMLSCLLQCETCF